MSNKKPNDFISLKSDKNYNKSKNNYLLNDSIIPNTKSTTLYKSGKSLNHLIL